MGASRGDKVDRRLVQLVVRAVTLETGVGWADLCLPALGGLLHRLAFTPGAAQVERRQEVDPGEEARLQADVAKVMSCHRTHVRESGMDRSRLTTVDETAVRQCGIGTRAAGI